MKNLFLALAIISLVSCQDDIQSSSPTLQGVRHGDYTWKSTARSATINTDGSIKIIGSDGFGTMIINLPNAIVGSYNLGQGKPSTITYTEGSTTYSTQNNGNEVKNDITTDSGDVTNDEIPESDSRRVEFDLTSSSPTDDVTENGQSTTTRSEQADQQKSDREGTHNFFLQQGSVLRNTENQTQDDGSGGAGSGGAAGSTTRTTTSKSDVKTQIQGIWEDAWNPDGEEGPFT